MKTLHKEALSENVMREWFKNGNLTVEDQEKGDQSRDSKDKRN